MQKDVNTTAVTYKETAVKGVTCFIGHYVKTCEIERVMPLKRSESKKLGKGIRQNRRGKFHINREN
jgi:hypothetical protein